MEEISQIKERILQFVKYKSITKQEFCNKAGISYGNMRGKSLKSELGGSQIAEVLHVFAEISPDWLLTGAGEMLRMQADEQPTASQGCEKCKEKERVIQSQQKTIDTQADLIECLQSMRQDCKTPEKKNQSGTDFPSLPTRV